jgi:hypothetical protein
VLCDHVRRVLDRVARLFVGAGTLQHMGREHVADVVRAVRQKARDGASAGVGRNQKSSASAEETCEWSLGDSLWADPKWQLPLADSVVRVFPPAGCGLPIYGPMAKRSGVRPELTSG